MPPILRTGEEEWFRRGSGFVVGQQASIAPQSSWGQLDGWWEGAGCGQMCIYVMVWALEENSSSSSRFSSAVQSERGRASQDAKHGSRVSVSYGFREMVLGRGTGHWVLL